MRRSCNMIRVRWAIETICYTVHGLAGNAMPVLKDMTRTIALTHEHVYRNPKCELKSINFDIAYLSCDWALKDVALLCGPSFVLNYILPLLLRHLRHSTLLRASKF